jgi:hypothetical protein
MAQCLQYKGVDMRLLLGSLLTEASRESEMFAEMDIVSPDPLDELGSGDRLRVSQIGRIGIKMRQ